MPNHWRSATAIRECATAASVKRSASTADNQEHAAKARILTKVSQGLEMPAKRLSRIQKQLDKLDIKEQLTCAKVQLRQHKDEKV